MGIKKFVAIVLVVSIVSLVPLQALAQIEPQITYDEWCSHLSELHSRLESAPHTYELFFWLSVAAALIGGTVTELAPSMTAYLITAGGLLGTLVFLLNDPRYKIRVEINQWKALGEPYFWFYPCE